MIQNDRVGFDVWRVGFDVWIDNVTAAGLQLSPLVLEVARELVRQH